MSCRLSGWMVFLFWLLGCSQSDTPETGAQTPSNTNKSISIPEPYRIEITGGKYRWHVRYPGPDGVLDSPDDIAVERDLHVPLGIEIELQLKSNDYVYLLSLPQFHLKQIAVPTLDFTLTFRSDEIGEFDLDGDEFCGDPHPELKGLLFVQSRAQFETWVREQESLQATKATESSDNR